MNSSTAVLKSIKDLLKNMPQDWLKLTTHRLDIYHEDAAKTEFLDELKKLIKTNNVNTTTLNQLPTAYDYIRLGHQLSSLLEWVLAEINQVVDEQVITFASKTMPILAVLRQNAIKHTATYIYYDVDTAPLIDEPRLKNIYGYQYQLTQVNHSKEIPQHPDGTVVFVTQQDFNKNLNNNPVIDLTVNLHHDLGSYILIHQPNAKQMVQAIQHVRRRETIAMSPQNCLSILHELVGNEGPFSSVEHINKTSENKQTVATCIRQNTGSQSSPLIASSGLSIQYAILMGLVENAITAHPDKPIKIILPPNCYGGTNDQSRRVADLIPQAEVLDLLVDGGADIVNSLESVLSAAAEVDGVPIVLAEIPTNPRVEVPDLPALSEVLSKTRLTPKAETAVQATFMVDQTFCPNVNLLNQDSELSSVSTISFSSGSKFPSGGRCIAGYCAANQKAEELMPLVAAHLSLSDNHADANQMNILAETMPSMPERIVQAYAKTRDFVQQIHALIPTAKIFYVSDDMALRGFKPSVFSLDLPVSADSLKERQDLQKQLNKKLIEFMITRHPEDCKNCVSYGQLKGSYWTIPATSTQGTTKEGDKDYVVRASISPEVDVAKLSQSFKVFCQTHDLI
ncbi:PLP-dependent transferase [Marinicella litoralis]|uniref:Cys/Met metabolism PLP-dependent enzyme n=1 Tax=Marinicella litoralis TaxID=644220 RepID=A0A4R6XDX1_9GAMM|nr:PLP-dependent transferase [Marinicella litoralis]TDR17502.1 Cys/Met metabolism PLP-dependent enzyme [Marinicella litoralis]